MERPGQFSLAWLLVEVSLIAVTIGLARQAVLSWGESHLAPLLLLCALALFGAAFGLFRGMLGAHDPPDSPGPVP